MEELLKTVDLTPTDAQMILVCVVLFVLFWKVLERALIGPYLALTERRERATVGAQSSAQEYLEKAQRAEQQYEEKVIEARVAAVRQRLERVTEAKKRAAAIIEKAESDAAQATQNARQEMEQKLGAIRSRVLGDSDSMADMVVERLMAPRAGESTK